ncbi:MAG: DUF4391 domain-containing protein [Candidatus Wallbacteria bacterium HGW-Wallbacteria-1]|jgi:hypothetical protein|uniref:DUF4391 domain-containing protein n=1 Tax=Candidatus Wallbacteria bacterium HGW-Wallbacteria-1 TaxID=2013854 RepID=A0A2N1PLR1_9BACT|nr:MAG: DUF4391 domain-containing protein [Candidatus Wallbacteria bacterium HGW-Wallbacteria-1]
MNSPCNYQTSAGLFDYPRNATFGRVVPKSKIYEHANPSASIKSLFVQQIEQIIWRYKLAPETINISATPSLPEIQIFSIILKEGELRTEALRCIDQAIPYPIIFELCFDGKVKPIAAFKRPNEADAAKWVISEYFHGGWVSVDTPRKPLPMVFDFDALYGHLLMPLMPYPTRPGEDLYNQVKRMELIGLRQRELQRCEIRLRKEKQFNRKVTINAELRDLKQELEGLTA